MSAFYLQTDNGRSDVLANLVAFLGRLPITRAWKVEITEHRKTRTDPQNHALFGLAYPLISAETGFTKDELHEAFCERHFGTVEREVMGQVVTRPYRTTTTGPDGRRDVMSAKDFGEFFTMVQQVAAEAGVFVPDPDPFWREKLREAA